MSLLAGSDYAKQSASNAQHERVILGSQREPLGDNFPKRGREAALKRRNVQIPCAAIGPLLAAFDALTIIVSSLLGAGGYQLIASGGSWNLDFHVGAGVAAAVIYVLIGRSAGFYRGADVIAIRRDAPRVIWQWLLTSLLLTLLAFLFRIGVEFSRGAILTFAALGAISLTISRSAAKAAFVWALQNGRVQGRRVMLVGLRDELAAIGPDDLLRRFGLCEVERTALPENKSKSVEANKAIISKLDYVLETARRNGVEEVVLALRWHDTRSVELVLERLRCSPLSVQLLPDHNVRYLTRKPSFAVGPQLSIELQRTPLSRSELLTKRILDIVLASIALVILSPAMLVTALVIKLESPGPALFRQQRSGFNEKRFRIFKFRTMSVMEDGGTVTQTTRNDSRVTGIGRMLRASSIDELPQLFNVLMGDMSVVGPRPHALAHDTQYGLLLADYAFRYHVKPGITGWAQVNGYRGETAEVALMNKRVELDLWYICNWNFALDILIILKTMTEVLRRRNAY